MKFSTIILLAASALTRSVLGHPLDLPFEVTEEHFDFLEKRQSGIILTTGASGATYPRLEVRQMQSTKPNQWTLLLLAMQQWQAQAQSNVTGYYQIAGIHGVPRVNYNNVGQCSTCGGTDGYCCHDSVLFPAWHRAYLALFEQEFLNVVNNIANTWPTSGAPTSRAQMQGAAATMRFPYWDWAAIPPNGGPDFPPSITSKTVSVNGPKGAETIINPLFRHDFADPSQLVYSPFITWDVTLRYPNNNAATASSQNNLAINAFNNIRANLQDQVYQLFTTCADYLHFSNDDAGSSSTKCSNSLEGIHNTIHTTSGGGPTSAAPTGGHMYYLATSAFDPVFWLHHCNVDRYFAIWQTINPTQYGASQVAPHNTWTIAKGSTQNKNSPLTPFIKDSNGDFWTTAQVQDWAATFHYTYPEFADSDGSKQAIQSYVNKLYGPSATATAGSSKRTAAPESAANSSASGTMLTPLVANNGSLFQYVANIHTPRYALNGSYFVFLFMGQPQSEEPSSWITDANLIGPMGVLAQDGMIMNKQLIAAGSVPLTRSLSGKVDDGTIPDLTEATVSPFLKQQLQWRIAGPGGIEVDPSTLPDFEVSVYASTATQPQDVTELPEYSDFIPMEEITKGKPGGLNSTTPTSSAASYSTSATERTVTVSKTVCPTATCTS